jgi:hypothetical protein
LFAEKDVQLILPYGTVPFHLWLRYGNHRKSIIAAIRKDALFASKLPKNKQLQNITWLFSAISQAFLAQNSSTLSN